MPGGTRTSRRLVLACLALAGLDVALALRVRLLQRRLAVLAAPDPRRALLQGDRFPRVTLFDAAGEERALLDPSTSVAALVLVSSASCGACDAVRPFWKAVVRADSTTSLRVLELVLDARPEELSDHESLGSPGATLLVTPGGDGLELAARLAGLPAAILVDGDGAVVHAFYGEVQAGLLSAVEDFVTGR